MMINTNFIISIYKTESFKKFYEINVIKFSLNNNALCKEMYNTEKERNKRYNEIISKLNNMNLLIK